MSYYQKPATPEEALAHFGVRGMKWGVRKERRQYSDNQIKDARAKVKFDEKHARRLERKFGKSAAQEAARLRANLAATDQARIAHLRTSGEKKAILIMTLGVGSVYLARNRAIYNPKVKRGRDEVEKILAERKAEDQARKAQKQADRAAKKTAQTEAKAAGS